MTWLNIQTSFLRSPEFMGSEPVQRATWLALLGFCCEQENGGRIESCSKWGDRRWQQTCGVTLTEIQSRCDLWFWEDDGVVLFAYPLEKEAEVVGKRKAGAKGGKASGEARKKAANEAPSEAELQATREAELQAELERKGREWNGKEGEEKGRERKQPAAGIVFPDGFPESHIPAMTEWFAYKRERKETYKPTGWSKLCNTQSQFPAAQVQASVDNSMANNWAGLFTEKTTVPDRPDESEYVYLDKMTAEERMNHFRRSYHERDWQFIQEDGSLDLMAKLEHNRTVREAAEREAEGEPPETTEGSPELW